MTTDVVMTAVYTHDVLKSYLESIEKLVALKSSGVFDEVQHNNRIATVMHIFDLEAVMLYKETLKLAEERELEENKEKLKKDNVTPIKKNKEDK